ncbi:rapid alkalinization factor-like [Nymphaea colorata]|nr:rapid alkalinization factor-like [Nymphaea colorata]
MAKLGVQLFTAMAAALLVAASLTGEAEAGLLSGESGVGWLPGRPACDGTIGECFGWEAEEMGMDSESNRRILQTNQYISYEALKRNSIPCSTGGASYYNCRPGAEANPYTRSCNDITRCARS